MVLFSGYIVVWALLHPDKVPPADPPTHASARSSASRGNLIPCTLLIVFIVWVLITGWATATECAAYGVLGSLAIAPGGRAASTWQNFWTSLMGATRAVCMIMFILAGAAFLTMTMAFTGIPRALAEWVGSLAPVAVRADRGAGRHLHRARHRARRHLDDRADHARWCCR